MSQQNDLDPGKEAAKAFAALGGRSGKGKAKKRSKAHYKRIAALSVAARRKEAAKRRKAKPKPAK